MTEQIVVENMAGWRKLAREQIKALRAVFHHADKARAVYSQLEPWNVAERVIEAINDACDEDGDLAMLLREYYTQNGTLPTALCTAAETVIDLGHYDTYASLLINFFGESPILNRFLIIYAPVTPRGRGGGSSGDAWSRDGNRLQKTFVEKDDWGRITFSELRNTRCPSCGCNECRIQGTEGVCMGCGVVLGTGHSNTPAPQHTMKSKAKAVSPSLTTRAMSVAMEPGESSVSTQYADIAQRCLNSVRNSLSWRQGIGFEVRFDMNATNTIICRGEGPTYRVTVGVPKGDAMDEIHIACFNAVMRLWCKHGGFGAAHPDDTKGHRIRLNRGAPRATPKAAANYWLKRRVTLSSTMPEVVF